MSSTSCGGEGYLEYEDLVDRQHRVGRGKIGGKAAGLVLAWKILQATLERFCDTPANQPGHA
jgi:hypothetical protein